MSNISVSCKCQIALAGMAEGLEHLEGCWMGKGERQEVGEAEIKRILSSKCIFQQCQQIILVKPGPD